MKTVLITGASRGIGQALVQAFGREHTLILNSKSKDINYNGHNKVISIKGDLSSESTIQRLETAAINYNLDILINNAGVHKGGSIDQLTEDDYKKVLMVNLLAPIILTKRIWPLFKKKKRGLIININSIAGKEGSKYETAYSASKHGLAGFFRSLQFESNQYGIKIIDVFLGACQTSMADQRKDFSKLIKVEEVADFLLNASKIYKTLRLTEVNLLRVNY